MGYYTISTGAGFCPSTVFLSQAVFVEKDPISKKHFTDFT